MAKPKFVIESKQGFWNPKEQIFTDREHAHEYEWAEIHDVVAECLDEINNDEGAWFKVITAAPYVDDSDITARKLKRTALFRDFKNSGNFDDDESIIETMLEIREQMLKGADPEELLIQEGIDPDNVLDLMD